MKLITGKNVDARLKALIEFGPWPVLALLCAPFFVAGPGAAKKILDDGEQSRGSLKARCSFWLFFQARTPRPSPNLAYPGPGLSASWMGNHLGRDWPRSKDEGTQLFFHVAHFCRAAVKPRTQLR